MDDWRATALVPDDAQPDPAAVASILGAIQAGQRVIVACRSLRFEMTGWVARMATVILTDKALIVAKDRIMGDRDPTGRSRSKKSPAAVAVLSWGWDQPGRSASRHGTTP